MKPIPDSQRLFFALWPDAAVRAALERHAQACAAGQGRVVARQNLHLTLVFIGNVAASGRACLEQAAAAVRCPPFELVLDRYGHFPRPQVYWLGTGQPSPMLLRLVSRLREAQSDCGLAPEPRPFRAHVTLARKVRRPPPAVDPRPLHWPVDRFVLVRSRTLPEGPVYTCERTWMLQEE